MLDKRIVKILEELDYVKGRVDYIKSDVGYDKNFENEIALKQLEYLSQSLDEYVYKLNYFSKDTRESILSFNDEFKRFYTVGYPLTCGKAIEIFYNDEWLYGRIEASNRFKTDENVSGYYFYNVGEEGEHKHLEVGMKVRERVDF